MFDQYFGWFSGDPADLNPLSNKKRVQRMALFVAGDVSGSHESMIEAGLEKMLREAKAAISKSQESLKATGKPICDDDKWALELARDVMSITKKKSWLHSNAAALKIKALYSLHLCSVSSNGRHYFLSSALEEQGKISVKVDEKMKCNNIRVAPLDIIFKHLALRIVDTKCGGQNATAIYKFIDDPKNPITFAVTIRNCVCDVIPTPSNEVTSSANFVVALKEKVIRDLFCKETSGFAAYAKGDLVLEKGGITKLKWFMDFFDTEP